MLPDQVPVHLSLVVAAAENEVIGQGEDLPWHLPADLARFARLTRGHAVIAGRVTHRSILARLGRPLPGRLTVVLSRGAQVAESEQVVRASSPQQARELAERWCRARDRPEAFVIGGAQVYQAFLPEVETVHLTRVHASIPGDTVLPAGWSDGFTLVHQERAVDAAASHPSSYLTYRRLR